MAARGRWRVAVLPVFAHDDVPPAPPPASPALQGPPPRLSELAVACGLSGAALDEELVNVRRRRSELAAYEAGLVERKAALGAAHHQQVLPGARTDVRADRGIDGDADPSLEAADDFLPDEVAALLGTSVPSARYLVEHHLVLVRQLPQVWHALADGRIDETRAAVVVKALRWQSAAHGGPVDDDVLAGVAALGVGWAERGCPPSTLRARLDAALIAADPAAADRRAELRQRGADVRVVGTGDGVSDLRAEQMDTADAKLLGAQLDAYARRLRADGDERPLGVLRVAVLTALVTRPWEERDPVVAHLTIDADLADLGPLPDLSALFPTAASSDDVPPDQTGPGHPGARDAAPDVVPPDGAALDEVPPHGAALDEVPPDGTALDEVPPDGAALDEVPPDGTALDEVPPDGTALDEVPSDGTALDEVPSDGTTFGEVRRREAAQCTLTVGGGVPDEPSGGGHVGGAGVGHVGGSPVGPAVVRGLLERVDALGLTDPDGGHLVFSISERGRLLAVAAPEELAAAARAGEGLGPPAAVPRYRPSAAQYRYLRARDRHCRFPGCRQVARACDADHVVPYDHGRPGAGGQTCTENLVMLCRRHHRLKTHAPGWAFRLDANGTLHVTTPGGTTRVTRPPALDQALDLDHPPPAPHDPVTDPPPF